MSTTQKDERDGNKTPVKINAFHFMMNSRHKVIGSNSPGKERKDEIKSPEMIEKTKEKLKKRKSTFENWVEKKGDGAKRKLLDEAAEKHINTTLKKRAKRLKMMLAIIDEELKNSGEECSDNEEAVIRAKIKKHKKLLIIESDDSSNADDINGNISEITETEKANQSIEPGAKEDHAKKSNEETKTSPKNIRNDPDSLTVNSDITSGISKMENRENAEVLNEINKNNSPVKRKARKKRSLSLKRIGKANESPTILKENNSDNSQESKIASELSDNEIFPTKLNKKSEIIQKKPPRKKSLSLQIIENANESPTIPKENKSDNQKSNIADGLSDEEIFPTKLDKKSEIIQKKSPRQLKLFVDSKTSKLKNEDSKNEHFSPRTWRMKLRLSDIPNTCNDSKESEEDKLSENKISEKNYPTNFKNDNCDSKPKHVIDSSPEIKLANKHESNLSSNSQTKKDVKIAPVFLRRQQEKLEKEALNAKKNFLHSGVPSKMKKLMKKSISLEETEYVYKLFPKVSHIQQKDESIPFWNLSKVELDFKNESNNGQLITDQINIGSFTTCKSINIVKNTNSCHNPPKKLENLKEIVRELKQEHPSYPVYKTFRLLYQKFEKHAQTTQKSCETPLEETPAKRKRGRPKKKTNTPQKIKEEHKPQIEMLMWTEKYKPQSQEEILGNTKSVQELKSWLEAWIQYSKDQKSRKRRLSNSSDDFCSDNSSTNDRLPHNLTLLFGPHGSGKTSSVYGLCNELSINVIEINASSKRTGKKILADLLEATQSHQVKNTDSKSVSSFFQKKPDSQNEDDINKKLSLLLFEDVDIVFEYHDESFISALSTLIISSKRPIILTFTDKECLHLQNFMLQYPLIKFLSLTSRVLSPWFQILCLIEGVKADKNMIDRLIQWNKGDVRKTLLQLQFWVQTGGNVSNKTHKEEEISNSAKIMQRTLSSDGEICLEDENSEMSWINAENNCDTIQNINNHKNCSESFISYYERDTEGFKLAYPIDLAILWWNIPELLGQKDSARSFINQNISENDNRENSSASPQNDASSLEELNTALIFLESLAISDNVHTSLKTERYKEPVYNYWQINPVDSLSLDQNVNVYNETYNTSLEIAHWMVENSAKQCQILFGNEDNEVEDINISIPYVEELSWRSKRHKGMEELLHAVHLSSVLDRRAICEDYQTILRTINRSENNRTITNNKRKNRFYHYFKNLNIHVDDTTYSLLRNTFTANHIE